MIKMQNTHSLITCFQMFRCISSSSICSSLGKQGKVLSKIMQGPRKLRKKWHDVSLDLRGTINNTTKKTLPMHMVRRIMGRNKLFMEHITDQISMGEVANMINGNIEITHVKITSDYNFIHVYWMDNTDNPSLLIDEETLQKCAKIIRHELSQLRVIGIVPPIIFIKNKQFLMEKEVDKRLMTLEEICETTLDIEQVQLVKSDINASDVNQTLKTRKTIKRKKQDAGHNLETDESVKLPIMRNDVLRLDHYEIMSRITASLSKSREAAQKWTLINTATNTDRIFHNPASGEVTEVLTRKEEQEIFSNFLANKRKEERQKYRAMRLLKDSEGELEESDHEKDDDDEEYSDGFSDEDEVSMNDFVEDK